MSVNTGAAKQTNCTVNYVKRSAGCQVNKQIGNFTSSCQTCKKLPFTSSLAVALILVVGGVDDAVHV